MSITATTLASACAAGDLRIKLTSTSGSAVKNLVNIDGEFLTQTAEADGGFIDVRRGVEATYAQAHVSGAVVLMGLPSDFPAAPPGTATIQPYAPAWNVGSVNAAGAVPVPTIRQNQFIKLKAGTGAALTIADPTYAIEGTEMIIQAEDAQAYTLTNSTGFNGGGGGADVATFGGAVGDNIHIKAVSATWKTIATRNVTIA